MSTRSWPVGQSRQMEFLEPTTGSRRIQDQQQDNDRRSTDTYRDQAHSTTNRGTLG